MATQNEEINKRIKKKHRYDIKNQFFFFKFINQSFSENNIYCQTPFNIFDNLLQRTVGGNSNYDFIWILSRAEWTK